MKHYYLICCIGLFFHAQCFSQQLTHEVLGSSGGEFSNGNIQLDWTLGELSVETMSVSSVILTEGFQQAELILVSTKNIDYDVNIISYPNPFLSYINIQKDTDKTLHLECMDVLGRLLKSEMLTENIQQIDLQHLASAIYFLKITDNNGRLIQVIKIQKN